MHNLRIHKATPDDLRLVREMALEIWPTTYSSILTPDQLAYMLERIYSSRSLEEQMQMGQEFILVYQESTPVGFASFSDVEKGVTKLHKLYVMASQQGKGTGRYVLDQVIDQMKKKGNNILRLNVNRHNPARNFYEKIGFTVVAKEDVDIGNGYFMNDYVMERRLE
ncbi:MAG: GNAT family N-acetyltransferase [Chitinophagaceae bacterium]|nr:GNAT family N-acetyltransferase [Chitinophagaceae bacterium]